MIKTSVPMCSNDLNNWHIFLKVIPLINCDLPIKSESALTAKNENTN